MHSATKFIGGHSDLLSGMTIARGHALAERLRQRRGLSGATPGALEAYLALRGLRTLALRLNCGQSNGRATRHRTGGAARRRAAPSVDGLNGGAGADLSAGQDVGAQAAAVDQRPKDALGSEAFQM